MYYIERGLGSKWKWLAVAFAFFGEFAALGIGNSVQSNTIADVVAESFHINGWVTGIILVVFTDNFFNLPEYQMKKVSYGK